VYTDNSKEFEKAMEDLQVPHDTSTPYRPQTNGVADRAVRRVKEGTSAALVQSGWDECWWDYAMHRYCMLRNIVDTLANGHTAYHNRFGIDFPGPLIPFGAEIRYKPSSPGDKEMVHELGDKMLPGIFMGYDQQAGGGWSGDLLLANQEEIRSAEHTGEIYVRRIPQKEVEIVKVSNAWYFPLATGDLRQPTAGSKPSTPRRRKLHSMKEEQDKEEG